MRDRLNELHNAARYRYIQVFAAPLESVLTGLLLRKRRRRGGAWSNAQRELKPPAALRSLHLGACSAEGSRGAESIQLPDPPGATAYVELLIDNEGNRSLAGKEECLSGSEGHFRGLVSQQADYEARWR